ncbi:MAG TPA: hypothetical protein VMU56_01535 [Beijerinckiaceae bacterium]|nr:hypothetical protein [Beijerinckiaceae bacterium]
MRGSPRLPLIAAALAASLGLAYAARVERWPRFEVARAVLEAPAAAVGRAGALEQAGFLMARAALRPGSHARTADAHAGPPDRAFALAGAGEQDSLEPLTEAAAAVGALANSGWSRIAPLEQSVRRLRFGSPLHITSTAWAADGRSWVRSRLILPRGAGPILAVRPLVIARICARLWSASLRVGASGASRS